MRVAFTSTDGEQVDRHFGESEQFWVWEVGPGSAAFVEKLSAITTAADEEDRIAARANAVAGCTIVYTMQIGGPAAAKLIAQKIHPMKTNNEVSLKETLERFQEVLRGNPPPWLRKAMNKGQAQSFLED